MPMTIAQLVSTTNFNHQNIEERKKKGGEKGVGDRRKKRKKEYMKTMKEREGGDKEGCKRDRDLQQSCSCPIHPQDHISYARVRTTVKHALFKALSRRFQVQHPKTCTTVGLLGPCPPRRVERDNKKRVHVSWSSQAVLEMSASGTHARQTPVNEPSGVRFFSGVWVEIGIARTIMARNSSWDVH